MFYQNDEDLYAEKDRKQRELREFQHKSCELDINVVEGMNLSSEWRIDTKIQAQIQAIETEFKKVCIDSGAAESVCPIDAIPDYETLETDKVGSRQGR